MIFKHIKIGIHAKDELSSFNIDQVISFLVHQGRVAKTLNSSYKPNPEILKLPTFSGMRRQNEET